MEDAKIVALFLHRDELAIQLTAEKYGTRLRSFSYGITQDLQTAQECENDTYMQAWNSIPPQEPRAYLYGFLARIIRHISLNRCRDRNRLKRSAYLCELSAELEQCIPAGGELVEDLLLQDALNQFLSSLSREKRDIFLRRYWYMDSIADISQRFALSQSKVKTVLFRCRNQLREQLEKEGYTI